MIEFGLPTLFDSRVLYTILDTWSSLPVWLIESYKMVIAIVFSSIPLNSERVFVRKSYMYELLWPMSIKTSHG